MDEDEYSDLWALGLLLIYLISGFAEALILIAQAILLFMQCTMRPDGCDDK